MKPGWTTVALGDVATIERRGVDPARVQQDTVYLGLEHIEAGGRIIGQSTIGDSAVASTKFHFGPEHILFGKLRPYLGKIASPDFAGVCSTDILPVLPSPSLDRGFLKHFLRQPISVDLASARAAGANLPRLSPSELARFELPLPPVEEQRHIAAILDRADALRMRSARGLELLALLRQHIVETALSEVSHWQPFGQLIASGPSNGLYKPSSAYGDGTPIIRIDSFRNGLIDASALKRLTVDGKEVERFGVQPGDILINRVNAMAHVGKSALVRNLREPTVYESNMMRIRVRDDCRPEFIAAWLATPAARRQMRATAKQAINQASINGRDVKSLTAPVASLAEQDRMVAHLADLTREDDQWASAVRQQGDLLRSLQARAFSGRL